MALKDLFERLHKAVEGLAQADGGQDDGRVKKMTPDQFLGYATEQIEAAAKDKPEIRKARLAHLATQIQAVAKNYEGPTPGAADVQTYKTPDQQTPTMTESAPPGSNDQTGTTNFSQEDPPQSQAGGVGQTPPGGSLPPQVAGGSGFATPEAATFAKAMEKLHAAVAKMASEEPAKAPEKPTQTQTQPAPEKTEKSLGVVWPLDMNTPFGLGSKDAPEHPDWGYDKGSTAERVFAQKAAPPATGTK